MKKTSIIFLVFAIILSFVACNSQTTNDENLPTFHANDIVSIWMDKTLSQKISNSYGTFSNSAEGIIKNTLIAKISSLPEANHPTCFSFETICPNSFSINICFEEIELESLPKYDYNKNDIVSGSFFLNGYSKEDVCYLMQDFPELNIKIEESLYEFGYIGLIISEK